MMTDVKLCKDWVRYNSIRYPGRTALENLSDGFSLTWSGLDDRVGRLAGSLSTKICVRRGDRIALICQNDLRIFELQFACMRLGATLVPLNWRLSPGELQATVEDAEPKALVHDAAHFPVSVAIAEAVGISRITWGSKPSRPDIDLDYESLMKGGSSSGTGSTLELDGVSHILYSSGTTGKPKGVLYTNRMAIAQAADTVDVNALAYRRTKQLVSSPLFHSGGLNAIANSLLLFGGTVSVVPRFDAESAVSLLGDPSLGYTHFHCVPTMWQMMAEAPSFHTADFSRMLHAHAAGGYLEKGLFDLYRDRGLNIQTMYGMTETGPAITATPVERAAECRETCGAPVRHVDIRLVSETGTEAADGEAGECWVRGQNVTRGYWRNVGAESFIDGWFRTGDALSRERTDSTDSAAA
jgi:fatty-acyl-CoA synthase